MSTIKPILGYWKIRGLAQPTRFLLNYLGIDYEEKHYKMTENLTKDNWYKDRAKLNFHFPNLPYFIDGNTKVTESRAIIRHICREKNPSLLGETNEVQLKIDMVENFMWDFHYMIFIEMLYIHNEEYIRKFKEQHPVKLGHLSKFIADNKWTTGNKITYLDFCIYEMLYQLKTFDPKILNDFKNLNGLMNNFEQLPAISSYIKSPRYIEKPCYTETAVYKI